MSTFENSKTHILNLGSLVSEIPNLIGFVPEQSLVLIGVSHDSISLTTRTDLPAAEDREALVDYLMVVNKRQAEHVVAVVVGGEFLDEHALVEELQAGCQRHGIGLRAVWTPALRAGEPWVCFHDADCEGLVHDTSASPLAAAAAASGFYRYNSREDIEATVAPIPDAARTNLRRRLQAWQVQTAPAASLRDAANPVFDALERLRGGEVLGTEQTVAALGTIHSNTRVRDLMFTIQESAAAQLWTILLRQAPDSYAADVAALLAVYAHLHGDSPLANVALDRALTATPTHRVATLLREMFLLPPDQLRGLIDDLATDPGLQL